jgi:HEAT repeat protein
MASVDNDINQWVADLSHGDYLRRWQAMTALGKQGAAAFPALIAGLHHTEAEVRWRAAVLLGWLGDAQAVPSLAGLLTEGYEVKINAVWALGHITDSAVLPRLLDILHAAGEAEPDIRYVAALALVQHGHLDAIRDALTSEHLPTYRAAHATLATARYSPIEG